MAMTDPISAADWGPARARHLLNRAGFGLTDARVAEMAALSPEAAVARLVDYETLPEASAEPVPVNRVSRQDIEIRPSYVTVPAGHRLRLVVKTGDTPHLLPPPMKQLDLLLGAYDLQNNATNPSYLDLSVSP